MSGASIDLGGEPEVVLPVDCPDRDVAVGAGRQRERAGCRRRLLSTAGTRFLLGAGSW